MGLNLDTVTRAVEMRFCLTAVAGMKLSGGNLKTGKMLPSFYPCPRGKYQQPLKQMFHFILGNETALFETCGSLTSERREAGRAGNSPIFGLRSVCPWAPQSRDEWTNEGLDHWLCTSCTSALGTSFWLRMFVQEALTLRQRGPSFLSGLNSPGH